MSVTIDPQTCEADSTIYLDEARTGWLTLTRVLDDYITTNDFIEDLFVRHCPATKTCVTLIEADGTTVAVPRSRWQQSYGRTPTCPSDTSLPGGAWYMFGSKEDVVDHAIPDVWQPYVNAAAKSTGTPFNQLVTTWYRGCEEYMQFHRDWLEGLVADVPISILTLTPAQEAAQCRILKFLPACKTAKRGGRFPKGLEIVMRHGVLVSMYGTAQTDWTHGILGDPDNTALAPRIGLTFRCYA